MTLDIFKEKGTPPDDDVFTRVRMILMNGLESDPSLAASISPRVFRSDRCR